MPKAALKSGLTLHYQTAGKGPDVVMVHGLTGNQAVWHLQIIPSLWDHFHMVTYDLRGHGYSDMPPTGYTADDMATDLVDLLDALDIEQTAVVGHSFGADIALYFALRYPERTRRVVAIEAALPALIQLRSRDEWEGWTYWAEVLEKSGCTVPPERRSDVGYLLRASLDVPKKWGPLNGLPRNPEPFLRLIETTSMPRDYEVVGALTLENIRHVQPPVLLIYGEASAFLGSHAYLSEHLPHVQSVLLPKTETGHFGPLEEPELVAQHILTFLKDGSCLDGARPEREL